MEVWLLMKLTADPALPDYCKPTTPFLSALSSTSHTCIPTHLALVSTVLGILSIAAWLFAQLPQILKNHALQSTSGLSIYFLVEWCFGDVTNLLGAVFTRQATWQVIVAAYYVSVDLMLVWQYAWYSHIRPIRRKRYIIGGADGADDGDSEITRRLLDGSASASPGTWFPPRSPKEEEARRSFRDDMQSSIFSVPDYSPSPPPKEHDSPGQDEVPAAAPRRIRRLQRAPPSPIASPRTFLFVSLLLALASAQPLSSPLPQPNSASTESSLESAGRVLSWVSTLLYLGSRLPQLYKNHSRRSTSGLSAKLFIAAFFGNLFYSTSLLTNPCAWNDLPAHGGRGWVGASGSNRAEWISLAAPFWLGAAGVLGLDAAVGLQFLAFGEGGKKVVRDEEGHWMRVSGWMKGWVPSVSVSSGESEILIPAETDERGYGAI
jgi:uncharacterized protein with PQ loop repeat